MIQTASTGGAFRMLKTIRNSFLIGVASVVIGYLLMVAVHAIPLNWTGQNYQNTVELLKREGMYPKETFSHRYLDNYADSVSMLLASYPGKESAWRKAANDYFLSYDGKEVYHTEVTPYDFLVGNYDPEKAHVGAATYARYWHGNLLLFKPLMCYFDYRQIRRVNSLLVLLATVAAIFLLFKRLPLTTPAFVVAILLLGPTALGKTIEFSCVGLKGRRLCKNRMAFSQRTRKSGLLCLTSKQESARICLTLKSSYGICSWVKITSLKTGDFTLGGKIQTIRTRNCTLNRTLNRTLRKVPF